MTNTTNQSPSLKLEEISETLRIYQQKGVFSYGTDAVLLSAYAASFMRFSSKRTLFDLCSGTGIIGLMLLDKFRDGGKLSVSAVEINKDACTLSRMSADCGLMCEDDYKTVARHEILCNLEDIFKAAFHLLKTGGTAFVVYRPDRLSTLFASARAAHFEIKNMTFVHSRSDSESKLVLCAARKNAREGLKIGKPFVMYRSGEEYSEEYLYVREKGEMRFE